MDANFWENISAAIIFFENATTNTIEFAFFSYADDLTLSFGH